MRFIRILTYQKKTADLERKVSGRREMIG